MAENTKIEWCNYTLPDGTLVPGKTFNPWEGCAKVSPGCKNCYAETQHNFYYSALKKEGQPGTCWGIGSPRLGRGEAYWNAPLRWNREAKVSGTRPRVFCLSLGDVFEEQSATSKLFAGDIGEVPCGNGKMRTVRFVDIAGERLRLLRLIYDTPHLDWLLLTKRPENIVLALQLTQHTPTSDDALLDLSFCGWIEDWLNGNPPANVWLGTSVENQEQADIRVGQLLAAPAAVRFLSCEPLLGPVDLGFNLGHKLTKKPDSLFFEMDAWYDNPHYICENGHIATMKLKSEALGRDACLKSDCLAPLRAWKPGIDWVIVGGESGPKARPMHPDWVGNLIGQCQKAEVPVLFKQWGNYRERERPNPCAADWERKGDLLLDWDGKTVVAGTVPADRVWFEFGDGCEATVAIMENMGNKGKAGRLYNGRTYDGYPQVGKGVSK